MSKDGDESRREMPDLDQFEGKFSTHSNLNRGFGMLLILFGVSLLLFPLITFLQGAYHQGKLERELIDRESELVAARADNTISIPDTAYSENSERRKFPNTRIIIPRVGLNAVVVEGFGKDSLRRGPGHLPGSAVPGGSRNCCIAGHRNLYGSWFRNLDKLSRGDSVILRTNEIEYSYRVVERFAVSMDDITVLEETSAPTLTLVTCALGGKSAKRLVVVAKISARN